MEFIKGYLIFVYMEVHYGTNHINITSGHKRGKEKVVEIINTDPSVVNSFSEDGWTPLHLAAYFGQKEIASFLFRTGSRNTY